MPLPSTLTPAVFAVPMALVPPSPQTLLLSWGGPGDPVPVSGVGTVGSPPFPNTPPKLFISKRAKVYFCSLYRR